MHRPATSRIDVIVVVLLAFILLGLVLVFLPRQREQGLRVQCMNNLKVIGDGVQSYHKQHEFLPPVRIADGYATWAVLLAPHVTAANPLKDWDERLPFVDQPEKVRQTSLPFFFCPARNRTTPLGPDGALGDYAGVAGNGDPAYPWTGPDANGPMILAKVLDRKDSQILAWRGRLSLTSLRRGISYTLLVGEKQVSSDRFGDVESGDGSIFDGRHPASFSRVAGPDHPLAPMPSAPAGDRFGSSHSGLCQFLVADGSVRTFANSTEPSLLGRLTTRD